MADSDVSVELERARFSIAAADALGATLNLRRTLVRVAYLAVPALGRWAAVTLLGPDVLRVAMVPGDGAVIEVPLRALSLEGRAALDVASLAPASASLADPSALTHLGVPAGWLAEVAGAGPTGGATATTVPLRAAGSAIGVLAVGGPPDPRIDDLAGRAATAVSAAIAFEERSALADALRRAVRPRPLPTVPGVSLGAAYRAASETTEVGGDFYEVRPDGGGWSLTLGDVCGKGVDAAVRTGQVRQALRTAALVEPDPAGRLVLVNSSLLELDDRSSVTVLHIHFEPHADGVALTVATGGHEPPLLRRRDGHVEAVPVSGTLLGLLPRIDVESVQASLDPGDSLVATTDGLVDAPGTTERWGTGRLRALLADCAGMHPQAIAERLLQTALEHAGSRPHDDMAVLVLQAGSR